MTTCFTYRMAKGKSYIECKIDDVERFTVIMRPDFDGGYDLYPINSSTCIGNFPTLWEVQMYVEEMDS